MRGFFNEERCWVVCRQTSGKHGGPRVRSSPQLVCGEACVRGAQERWASCCLLTPFLGEEGRSSQASPPGAGHWRRGDGWYRQAEAALPGYGGSFLGFLLLKFLIQDAGAPRELPAFMDTCQFVDVWEGTEAAVFCPTSGQHQSLGFLILQPPRD